MPVCLSCLSFMAYPCPCCVNDTARSQPLSLYLRVCLFRESTCNPHGQCAMVACAVRALSSPPFAPATSPLCPPNTDKTTARRSPAPLPCVRLCGAG